MRLELLQEEMVVRLGREFTPLMAQHLGEALTVFAPVRKVTVDLTRCRGLEDAALAQLGRVLEQAGVKLVFRGVSQHQTRVLHYCLAQAGTA